VLAVSIFRAKNTPRACNLSVSQAEPWPDQWWIGYAPPLLLATRSSPDPVPHWSGQVSALTDWFLYLKPIPHARLIHHPDDRSSKDLWNVGKLLPNYTVLQSRRQPSWSSSSCSLHTSYKEVSSEGIGLFSRSPVASCDVYGNPLEQCPYVVLMHQALAPDSGASARCASVTLLAPPPNVALWVQPVVLLSDCPVLWTPRCPLKGPVWTYTTFLWIWVVLDLLSADSQWCSSTPSLNTTELASRRNETNQIVQPQSKVKVVLVEHHRGLSGGHLRCIVVLLATLEERRWEAVPTLWHLCSEPGPDASVLNF
jgi:hypothetical protein